MAVNRRKNNQKAQPKKMSLRDRLSRHWEAGKWEAFIGLYLRDKEASDHTLWADRYLDALYNCLTQSLFIHRNPENAREMARIILDNPESGLTEDSGKQTAIFCDCARVALDFLAMRQNGGAVPQPLSGGYELPDPWRTLRAGLIEAAEGARKRGRKKKTELPASPAAGLLNKLSTQFKALPEARNLRAYTSFLQTAEALEKETAGQAGAANFQAVRAVAALLRELGGPLRGGDVLRDLADLQTNKIMRQIPKGVGHPAVLGLWNFFCAEGGKKFGRDWEAAARVLRLRFDSGRSSLVTAYQTLVSLGPTAPSSFRVLAVKNKYDEWSEPEQFILGAAFCIALENDGPGVLSDIGGEVLLEFLEKLTALGHKWRPTNPWPKSVSRFFELMVRTQGPDFLRVLKFSLPYESLTVPTLALMSIRSSNRAQMVYASVAARLPLKLEPDEIDLLSFDLAGMEPATEQATAALKTLLEPKSLSALLAAWVRAVVEISSVNAVVGGGKAKLAWDRLSPGLLAFFEENLPADEPAGIFCRLCLNQGYRSLSKDPKGLALMIDNLKRLQERPSEKNDTFGHFTDEPEEDGFAAFLFIFLTTWPEVDLSFLLNLFRLGQFYLFEQTELWAKAVEAVSLIKDGDRRHALARILAVDLNTSADPARREALRCFKNIQKGRKVSPNPPKMDFNFDMFMDLLEREGANELQPDFEKEMLKKFEKLMGGRRRKF